MITMPDIDTGQRGTGVVNVIKLQTDVNHDGVMDLSFAGPDNTSQARPFVFWLNNSYDRLHWVDGSDLEQDDLERVDSSVYCDQTDGNMDCAFRGYEGKRAIPCTRDLEDYTRLWLPGMSSLMTMMPTNYTVKLTLNGDGQIRVDRHPDEPLATFLPCAAGTLKTQCLIQNCKWADNLQQPGDVMDFFIKKN